MYVLTTVHRSCQSAIWSKAYHGCRDWRSWSNITGERKTHICTLTSEFALSFDISSSTLYRVRCLYSGVWVCAVLHTKCSIEYTYSISHVKHLVIRDGNTAICSLLLSDTPGETPYYLHYVRDTLGHPPPSQGQMMTWGETSAFSEELAGVVSSCIYWGWGICRIWDGR